MIKESQFEIYKSRQPELWFESSLREGRSFDQQVHKRSISSQVMIYDTHGGNSFVFGILRNNDELDPIELISQKNFMTSMSKIVF